MIDKRLVAAVIVIAVIALGVAFYAGSKEKSSCGDFKIIKLCAMTNRIIVETQGSCKSVTMKFYDEAGELRAEAAVGVGSKTVVPLEPNLPPGRYRVDVYTGDSLVESFKANVSLAPYVVRSQAVAWPNGTIIVNFQSQYPPCLDKYGITAVIVRLNDTTYNVTGFWPAGEKFTVHVDHEITPNTRVIVVLVDSLGDTYRAAVLQPT